MAIYLNTRGRSTLGIGLCARCSKKFPLEELSPDPNYPALMVCRKDIDQYDPWRLAPRPSDKITLPFYRPDVPLDGFGTTPDLDFGVLLLESGGELLLEDERPILLWQ